MTGGVTAITPVIVGGSGRAVQKLTWQNVRGGENHWYVAPLGRERLIRSGGGLQKVPTAAGRRTAVPFQYTEEREELAGGTFSEGFESPNISGNRLGILSRRLHVEKGKRV